MIKHRLHRTVGQNPRPESVQEHSNGAPSHEEIAALAYQLWIFRARPIGSPEVDWFRAEAELKNCLDSASSVDR